MTLSLVLSPPLYLHNGGIRQTYDALTFWGFRRQRSTKYLNVRTRSDFYFYFANFRGHKFRRFSKKIIFHFFLGDCHASDNESTTESRGGDFFEQLNVRAPPPIMQAKDLGTEITWRTKATIKINVPFCTKQQWAKKGVFFNTSTKKGVGRAILGLLSNLPSSQFFLASLPPSMSGIARGS